MQTWPMGCWPPTPRWAMPRSLRLAVRLIDRLIADFWDEASGTLFDTAEEA